MDEFFDLLYGQICHILDLFTDYSNLEDVVEHNVEMGCSVTQDICDLDMFVTFILESGRRLHHTEMIAEGLISQKDYDDFADAIADAARKTPEFEQKGIFIFPPEE